MKKVAIIIIFVLIIVLFVWWLGSDRLTTSTESEERLVFIRDIYRQDNRDFMSIDNVNQLMNDEISGEALMSGLEFLPVDQRVEVEVVDQQGVLNQTVKINWSEFKERFQTLDSPLLNSPFLIKIADDEIVSILEVVIP